MTIARDTFVAFVDTLAEVLDDHESQWATGDELATLLERFVAGLDKYVAAAS